MIIECFALPEVGKSTLIKDLKKKYDIKSVSDTNVSRVNALFFLLKHPIVVFRFVLILLMESSGDEGGWGIARFKLSVFINTISRLQFAISNYSNDDIVIIDEGLVQRLLSLYETKQPANRYVTLLKKLPIADSVLFLEYTGESDRIKMGRVGTVRRSINDAYTEKWRSTMLHNYHSLVEALESMQLKNTGYSRSDNKWFDLDLVMEDLKQRKIKYLNNGK